MNIQIMKIQDLVKWFKPTTETESVLIEKIQEAIDYEPIELNKANRELNRLDHELNKSEQQIEELNDTIDRLYRKIRDKDDELKEWEEKYCKLLDGL